MRVFVAGASGVIGRALVPLLRRAGHRVIAITRSSSACRVLRDQGVDSYHCDVFDQDRLRDVFWESSPQAVINQLTSIPAEIDPRRIGRDMAATDRLRIEGTRILTETARLFGIRRLISQSVSFVQDPDVMSPCDESVPLYRDAPASFSAMIRAVGECERLTMSAGGMDATVLRYGYFYGPGTIYAADGSFAARVRKRGIPVIGNGSGVFSFVHVADAAAATLAALESGATGIYNIVDDDPAPVREWLPLYAKLLGARPPRRLPALLGRAIGGSYLSYMMLRQCGSTNARARAVLPWAPAYGSWRDGFAAELRPAALPRD